MKRARFSEEQILEILKAGEQAEVLPLFCEAQNITERTYQKWRARHGADLLASNGGELESRSDRTRDVKAVNQLGLQLVALSPHKLAPLQRPAALRSAMGVGGELTMGARGRKTRLVCKILRSEDHEAIRKRVESR
jgi:ribosome-associated protein